MSYDPSQDRPPSPVEVGELFVAARQLAVVHGAWTLGDPNQSDAADWGKPTFMQEKFFGLPGFVVGDIAEIGEYPVASYPPTHLFLSGDPDLLSAGVPDAEDVLGAGAGDVQVAYHEPYIKSVGGTETPQKLAELQPQPPDCAFILYGPDIPGLSRRTYRLTPTSNPKYFRGSRIDVCEGGTALRGETGIFPDLQHTEWGCLMRLVQCAAALAVTAENDDRTPQEE